MSTVHRATRWWCAGSIRSQARTRWGSPNGASEERRRRSWRASPVSDLVTWVRAQWDRTAGFTLLGLGAVLLVFGWLGVSSTSNRAGQLSYLVSGGMGGLFCLA